MIIYIAKNKITERCYIGKTSKSLEYRKNGHLKAATNGSKIYFHSAIRKYGFENFEWDVICECQNIDDLNYCEKVIISAYKLIVALYNIAPGGEGGDTFSNNNRKEEIRNNMKERKGIRNGFFKKRHSIKTIQDLSEKIKLKWEDEHYRTSITSKMKGIKHSEETCKKRSILFSGKNNPMYGTSRTGINAPRKTKYKCISPDGIEHIVYGNKKEFCEMLGISLVTFKKWVNAGKITAKNKKCKIIGWEFIRMD